MMPLFLADSGIVSFFKSVFNLLTLPIKWLTKILMYPLIALINTTYGNLCAGLLNLLLRIVDFFEKIFSIFAGIDTVTYYENGAKVGSKVYLLDIFFTADQVSKAVATLTLVGVILCFVFTIYSVVKSIGSSILDNKRPVGHVLTQALKASVCFLIVPVMCYVGLQLTSAVATSINNAICVSMGTNQTVPMSTVLFLSGTDSGYNSNVSTLHYNDAERKYDLGTWDDDGISKNVINEESLGFTTSGTGDPFAEVGTGHFLSGIAGMVKEKPYNYLVVYVEILFVIIIMMCAVVLFIRRMIELLLLYVVSPLYVSTIPLDDGATFKRWVQTFIGKLVSGFGVIFSMKIVTMMIPVVLSGNFHFSANSATDNILKTVFAIGSIYAAYKSQHTIVQIINPEAASAAQESTGALILAAKETASLVAAAASGGTTKAAQTAAKASSVAGDMLNFL